MEENVWSGATFCAASFGLLDRLLSLLLFRHPAPLATREALLFDVISKRRMLSELDGFLQIACCISCSKIGPDESLFGAFPAPTWSPRKNRKGHRKEDYPCPSLPKEEWIIAPSTRHQSWRTEGPVQGNISGYMILLYTTIWLFKFGMCYKSNWESTMGTSAKYFWVQTFWRFTTWRIILVSK